MRRQTFDDDDDDVVSGVTRDIMSSMWCPAPDVFGTSRIIPSFDFIRTIRMKHTKLNFVSLVTPFWPRALNICNRCEKFTSHWLLSHPYCTFVSLIYSLPLMRLSNSLCLPPLSFFSLSCLQRFTIFTLLLPSYFLSFFLIDYSWDRSVSLSRLLFNPSTLRSIAILLYLLFAQSPCSLESIAQVCYPPSKKPSYRQGRVTSNSRYMHDSPLAGSSLPRLKISRVIDIHSFRRA